MSDKKPLPTFGDVMMGVPAGQGGQAKAPEADKGKKGPMVVVKRAGGAVETKRLEPEKPSTKHAAAEVVPAAPAPKAVVPVPSGPSVADDVHEAESFAEMLEKQGKDALPARKLPRVGEKLKGTIFQLGAEMAFVTVGRHEAMIALDELKDEEGILRLGVGQEVEAHVIETGAKGIILSKKLSKSAASVHMLADARASGIPVEGIVLGVNKGGIEVAVGDVRAFCPSSQIDVRPSGKVEELIGQRLMFRVTEVKDRNVVLSRRAILEEELKVKGEALKKELSVGKVLKGRVVSVQAFGAFVDLGGLEGLIPVSELSHTRIGHPSEVVKMGDAVEVEIIRMEQADPHSPDKSKRKDRITLSMRARMEDPFKVAMNELKEGQIVKGKVVRLQPFGAFVELRPGVDGLVHISAMSDRRIAHPRDVLKVGDEVEAKVEKLDAEDKRIALRLVKDGVAVGEGVATSSSAPAEEVGQAATAAPAADSKPRAPRPKRGQIVVGKVNRVEPFGVFIEWDGFVGMIPASETGTDRGTDLKRTFAMGKELKAEVIEINGEKLKLSLTQAQRSEERADLEAWKAQESKKSGSGGGIKGFGTLADKLKGLALK